MEIINYPTDQQKTICINDTSDKEKVHETVDMRLANKDLQKDISFDLVMTQGNISKMKNRKSKIKRRVRIKMVEMYSAFKENGNQKPTNLINSALKELGANTKFKAYEVGTMFAHVYKKNGLEPDTDTYTVDGKDLTFECDVRDLYLDDEDYDRVTGQYLEIIKISYDGKSIDVEIAI